jgi:outer membrane immunogenic protein
MQWFNSLWEFTAMKRAIVVSFGLVALAVLPAAAADMPVKAPPPAPPMAPVFSWTGFYIGGNAGAAINDTSHTLDPSGCFLTGCGAGGVAANPLRTFSSRFNQAAFTGGGQIGYNWQFAPAWVVGLETDFNFDGLNQTDTAVQILPAPLAGTFNHSVSHRRDWFGTARARLGWLPIDRVMLYATGGLAYGRVASSTAASFSASLDTYAGSISTTRVGWTAGGGIEWAFTNNWTAKAEYLFVDLGSVSYTDACIAACGILAPAYQTGVTTREHIARVGINYLFNAGPAFARY